VVVFLVTFELEGIILVRSFKTGRKFAGIPLTPLKKGLLLLAFSILEATLINFQICLKKFCNTAGFVQRLYFKIFSYVDRN
jgi:hypothetical protein